MKKGKKRKQPIYALLGATSLLNKKRSKAFATIRERFKRIENKKKRTSKKKKYIRMLA